MFTLHILSFYPFLPLLSDPSLDEPEAVLPDHDDGKDEEKVEKPKRKGKLNKPKQPKDTEGKGNHMLS